MVEQLGVKTVVVVQKQGMAFPEALSKSAVELLRGSAALSPHTQVLGLKCESEATDVDSPDCTSDQECPCTRDGTPVDCTSSGAIHEKCTW